MDGKTNAGKDALLTGQLSAADGSNPSTSPEKVYSESYVRERHSKLDKAISSLTKERDELRQGLDAARTEMTEIQKRIDEAEQERLKGDPNALTAYQIRKRAEERERVAATKERELSRKEAELKAKEESYTKIEREVKVSEIAKKYSLDTATLEDLGIDNLEALEKVASKIAGVKTPTPDSGLSTGGAGAIVTMTRAEYAKKSVTELAQMRKDGKRIKLVV